MRQRHPFLDHPTPIPFVHRGGPTGLPENTLVAFDRAYSMGFRYFETDVHATADGVLVAFHDRSLKRLAGQRVPISTLTAAEIAQVSIEGEPVPLLEDLLSSFPDANINIDAKADATIRPLARVLLESRSLDRVCLASFSDRRLRWLRLALGHRACTSAGPREIGQARWNAQRGRPIDMKGVDVVQLPMGPSRLPLLDSKLLTGCHDVGLPVHVWTVNERSSMESLLERGVDGIMSDDPEVLRSVFSARGIWRTEQH